MAEFLFSIDLSIFDFINNTISNTIFDKFFPFITNVKNWYIAYIILWSILIVKGGNIGKIASLGIIFLIITSDQFSSHLLKNIFERIRPCNALENVNILINCSSSYSFPSSHAVNNFAVATYFYRLFPKLKWILFIMAFIIAISRPYVGVHYPSDIFAGAIIGIIIGYIFAYFTLSLNSYLINKRKMNENKT
jgi:undecaprenyl-diphosphatase